MLTLKAYLEEYSESHMNPTNVWIHKICVPAIMFSTLGIIKAFPVPASWPLWLDWSVIVVALVMIFYASFKNIRVFLSQLVLVIPMMLILELLRPRFFLLCIGIFIVAWIGQFIGHKIEGKKPSFFRDLFYLLIGPVWTMNSLTAQMGIDLKITSNATDIC
ncbi:Mpo1-like protein [Bacteriovorax sp. PP10]|uniref:Mpo1-like protein n=1 Tax=Bacteriovorax antarcticus TaxID=3088717 RepID=A0ABU5VZU6_9BACT|nr:Mpo1-like protein [Bacteriovorax sp. PP10]MEA9357530.1 Mpo1-like protein [Bacteriovorax sp. PP10]